MRPGLRAKILLAFLLLSLTPLCLSALFIFFNATRMQSSIVSRTTESLDAQMARKMQRKAAEVASSVRSLLFQVESDLHSLILVTRTKQAYLQFSKAHQGEIWERWGNRVAPRDTVLMLPLYREVEFVGSDGMEKIRIEDGMPRKDMRFVKNPQKTTYRCETYFSSTIGLPPGKIYVSHVTGWHVDRQEQLRSAPRPEDSPDGKQYEGLIRFAQPAFDEKGKCLGVVVLGLDHRHLMELTQHVNPLDDEPILFPSYDSGNYAFLFDDEGWIITHPKYWDIRGLDPSGRLVPAYTETSSPSDVEAGSVPFNLLKAGFIHENYPRVALDILSKKSGAVTTVNVGRTTKVMAYAPVLYTRGEYQQTGVFGGVTIGAQATAFHRPAGAIAEAIDGIISFTMKSIYILISAAAVAAVLLAFSFSRHLTRPLNQVVRSVHTLAEGPSYKRVEYRADDELGDLARSVNQLAYQLETKQEKLDASFDELERSKEQLVTHARELEHRLHLLEEIQRISDLLGTTFDLGPFLQLILRTSVTGMGFDRAVLYLLDHDHEVLQCRESFGFASEQIPLVKRAPYRMGVHDCVETRVVREKRLIYVPDIASYAEATPLDIAAGQTMGSRALAYAPLMVQEDVIGILGVGRCKTDAPISEIELHSLQILANHAARVIEMSRLYGEILEDRASLDGILQSMLAGILAVDTRGMIKSLNIAAERMLGVDREDIIGAPLKTAFSADAEAAEVVQGVLEWGERYGKFEMRFKAGDDERVFYLSSSKIFSHAREPLGVIIVIQDITEKKQFDEHVGRMERLASLGRLAAGVAHEIRNPLTGLTLLLDDLHDRSTDDPAMQSQLQSALAAMERIEHLVTELLAHASPQKEIIEPCDINQLIENTVALVRNQAKKARVATTLDLDRNLSPYEGDPHRLAQAVLNVVLNAIQAMPDGGTLHIGTMEIDADLLEHDNLRNANLQGRGSSVIIRVTDSGIGIPREIRQRVFEPFFTTKREGTGLGLYITHQIVTDHGGDLFISENSGGGTVFSIFLPRNGRRHGHHRTGKLQT